MVTEAQQHVVRRERLVDGGGSAGVNPLVVHGWDVADARASQ